MYYIILYYRYCIVNCLDESINITQRGSREALQVLPYQAKGWHKSKAYLGTTVQIKSTTSLWSLGTVDLNEVGRSVLHLPKKKSNPGDIPFVVMIEVKVAEPTDNCSVVVVIWQASIETSTALAIRNSTDIYITVIQADIECEQSIKTKSSKEQEQEHININDLFEICLLPSSCVPFGWADPDGNKDILITVGSCFAGASRVVRLNFLKAGGVVKLPDNTSRNGLGKDLIITVVAEKGGRVLHISNDITDDSTNNSLSSIINSSKSNESENEIQLGSESKSFGFSFSLSALGLSLVVERPIRREFLSLYIEGLEGKLKTKGALRSFEFMIVDLQIDNYSETTIYPVLLHSMKKDKPHNITNNNQSISSMDEKYKEKDIDFEEVPLLYISLIEETSHSSVSSTLKYVAVR